MENDAYEAAIEERQAELKKEILEALREMPIVQYACKKVGIARATYYRWRNEDSDFARESDRSLQDGRELINDMSESQLITLLKEKRMPAISMWLKSNSERYRPHRPPVRTREEEERSLLKLIRELNDADKNEDE